MNRRRHHVGAALVATALWLLLAGCADDAPIPPTSIATRTPAATTTGALTPGSGPAAPATEVATTGPGQQGGAATPPPAPPPSKPPVPLECSPPSPEPAGTPAGSDLSFSGVCTFTETAKLPCSTQPDDFLLQFQRDTPDGPKLYYHVNIEFFKGPGTYTQSVQMIFEIPDNGTIYEWDTQNGSATIDSGEKSGSINNVTLPADPGTPSQGTVHINGTFACL